MLDFLLPPGILEGAPPYWYAVVREEALQVPPYDGRPRPASENEEPRVVVLEPGGDQDAFVSLYDATLGYIGDSWYATREAALDACVVQFGDQLSVWRSVPAETANAESFVLSTVGRR